MGAEAPTLPHHLLATKRACLALPGYSAAAGWRASAARISARRREGVTGRASILTPSGLQRVVDRRGDRAAGAHPAALTAALDAVLGERRGRLDVPDAEPAAPRPRSGSGSP